MLNKPLLLHLYAWASLYLDIVELVPLNVVVVIVTVALDCGAVVVRYVPQLMGLVPGTHRNRWCFSCSRTTEYT